MNNNIYDQGKEEKVNVNKSIKERNYFLEDTQESKEKRLLQSTQNRQGMDSEYLNRKIESNKAHAKSTNKKTKKVLSKQGKNFIKRTAATIGAVGLMIAGTNVVVGKIEEYGEQKRIDKSMTDDYNEYIQDISEAENSVFTKNDLDRVKDFYSAIENYKNSNSLTDKVKAKSKIIEYMESGQFENIAKATIDTKIEQAVLYGDYKKDNSDSVEVIYIKGTQGESDMFRIKGINAKHYSMSSLDVWSEDIPENLKDLAEDIFKLQENKCWKDEEQCVKVAINMSEDLGKVVQEYYTLDKDADIKRVSEKDFENAKSKYEKQLEEDEKALEYRVYEKYGVKLSTNKENQKDIER